MAAEERDESCRIGLMVNDRIPTVTVTEDASAMELGSETPKPGTEAHLSTTSKEGTFIITHEGSRG